MDMNTYNKHFMDMKVGWGRGGLGGRGLGERWVAGVRCSSGVRLTGLASFFGECAGGAALGSRFCSLFMGEMGG